jgi:hypothetical protein
MSLLESARHIRSERAPGLMQAVKTEDHRGWLSDAQTAILELTKEKSAYSEVNAFVLELPSSP